MYNNKEVFLLTWSEFYKALIIGIVIGGFILGSSIYKPVTVIGKLLLPAFSIILSAMVLFGAMWIHNENLNKKNLLK